MQTCNERDKQVKLIEELSNKYILLENDKNELEHLVNINLIYPIKYTSNLHLKN